MGEDKAKGPLPQVAGSAVWRRPPDTRHDQAEQVRFNSTPATTAGLPLAEGGDADNGNNKQTCKKSVQIYKSDPDLVVISNSK
jgi:hypothetical protein